AASSGALSGAGYAAAVRGRRERDGAAELAAFCRERAHWGEFLHLDWRDLVNGRGVSDLSHIVAILRDGIPPVRVADRADINLRIVLAATAGMPGTIGDRAATTYEALAEFDGGVFDDQARLDP